LPATSQATFSRFTTIGETHRTQKRTIPPAAIAAGSTIPGDGGWSAPAASRARSRRPKAVRGQAAPVGEVSPSASSVQLKYAAAAQSSIFRGSDREYVETPAPGSAVATVIGTGSLSFSLTLHKWLASLPWQPRKSEIPRTAQQPFQFGFANCVPAHQSNPMQACSIWSWDYSINLDKLKKAFRIGRERQNGSAVFFKVNLGEHLSPGGLIANPEDDLVAPPGCVAGCFNHMRQRREKYASALGIHRSTATPLASRHMRPAAASRYAPARDRQTGAPSRWSRRGDCRRRECRER